MWDTVEIVLRGKNTVFSAYIKQEKRSPAINDLENLEKGEQSKPKADRKKKIKLRAKNNKIESKQ